MLNGLYLKDVEDLGIVEEHSDGAVEGGVEEDGINLVGVSTAVLGCRPLRKHLTLCLWPKMNAAKLILDSINIEIYQ